MKKRYSYLALDAHSGHSQLAVLAPNGALVSCKSYPTSAPELIESVTVIKGHKKMVVEESQIADWVKRTLEPYVDTLIIADPKVNAWIAKSQQMNDKTASIRLARLLRGGYINPVYHADSQRQQFKELVLHYYDITKQITRFKNKLKNKFISRAIVAQGRSLYCQKTFSVHIDKLSHLPFAQFQAKNYFALVRGLEKLQEQVLKKIYSYSSSYPEIKQFQAIPGIGPIRAFTIVAIIDTPHRFSNKRKLWAYSCLTKSEKISNGKLYSSASSTNGNRLLKYTFLQAAMDAIDTKHNSVFKRTAQRLYANGASEKNVRRSVARQIASIILKIWKTGEPFKNML